MNNNELKAISILKYYMQISDVDTSRIISDALKELEDLVEKDKQKNCRECYTLTGKALEMLQQSVNSLKEELSFYKNNNKESNDYKFDDVIVEKKLFKTKTEIVEPEYILTQSKKLKEKRESIKSKRSKNFKSNLMVPNKILLVTHNSEPKEVYVKYIDTRPPKKGEYYSPQGLYFSRAYICESDMMFGNHYIIEISDKPFN